MGRHGVTEADGHRTATAPLRRMMAGVLAGGISIAAVTSLGAGSAAAAPHPVAGVEQAATPGDGGDTGSGGGPGRGRKSGPAPASGGVVDGVDTRIVGGARTSTTEHPWVVFLTDPSGFQFCGGTLVSPTKVLTAAHCMASTPATQVKVVSGRDDKQSADGDSIAVTKAWTSPDFQSVGRGLDTSVLTLATPSTRTPLPLAGAPTPRSTATAPRPPSTAGAPRPRVARRRSSSTPRPSRCAATTTAAPATASSTPSC